MGGHQRPAGGREMLDGPPRANAACRVFPKQAISEIEGPVRATQPRGSQAGHPGQHPNPSRLDSSQNRQGSWSISAAARWPVSRAVDTDRVEVGPEPLSVNRQSTRECLIAAHIGSWASLSALTSHSPSLTDHPRSVMSTQTTWCLPRAQRSQPSKVLRAACPNARATAPGRHADSRPVRD
jgi:hypothetical protein